MEQPSTPESISTAAATAAAKDHSSIQTPEPPSTRPNPFDDCDLSARKRRRTSASSSPAPCPSPSAPGNAPLAGVNLDTAHMDPPHTAKDMTADGKSVLSTMPQTPIGSAKGSSAPSSSSKVTLSLRRAAGAEAGPAAAAIAEPPSPTPGRQVSSQTIVHPQPTPAPSKPAEENEAAVDEESVLTTPNMETSHLSDSASPPVELIAISDNESDESEDCLSFPVHDDEATETLLRGQGLLSDPTMNFPFISNDQFPIDAIQWLLTYLVSDSPLDIHYIVLLQTWIEDYLNFESRADRSLALAARSAHRDFWLTFPSLKPHLLLKSREAAKSLEFRDVIINLHSSLSRLTARMVALDLEAWKDYDINQAQGNRDCLDVYCTRYLQQLHDELTRDACLASASDQGTSAPEWLQNDAELSLLGNLEFCRVGNLANLSQLATLFARLIPRFHSLTETLISAVHVISDCLHKAVHIVGNTQGSDLFAAQAKKQLEMGSTTWNSLVQCFELIIEKHVTQLAPDTATILFQALIGIYRCTLCGEHENATEAKQRHTMEFPGVPAAYRLDAMTWQWRVDILERMIRSSQMQLRMMAISRLCADLVLVWRNASDMSNVDGPSFLEYIGHYLLRKRLVDYMFEPNCPPEIIVESSNILGFLIINKMYKREHTDRVWLGLTFCQNPRVAEALIRMVTNITHLFDYDDLTGWCDKFQTLPFEGFSPAMRGLVDCVVAETISQCRTKARSPSIQPFDLCLRLLRKASVRLPGSQIADPDLQRATIYKVKELLKCGIDPRDRKALCLNCVQDVTQKSSTTLGSLWFLSLAIQGLVSGEVHELIEQRDLAKLVVEELSHATQAGHNLGAMAVLSGDSNSPRRSLVSYIIQFLPMTINNDTGTKLLDILIGPQSPCAEDRKSGWGIIIDLMSEAPPKNPFLQTNFSNYLPHLPASCFSDGMLQFVRRRMSSVCGDRDAISADDRESVHQSSIEQLWRVILEAEDSSLVYQAISILVIDLHLDSKAFRSDSITRILKSHVSLVTRCLNQMRQAAKRINGSSESVLSDDDEPMVIISTNEEIHQQERVFRRSLQVMRFFIEQYGVRPQFAVADLRPLMASTADDMKGASAQLKYQAFDGDSSTQIKPLPVGSQNTAASFLAHLKGETGFDNFRVFYRGQPLCLTENLVGRPLDDLCIRDHLVLVKKEESHSATARHVKPGSTLVEIEILGHFQDLWDYLSMDELLAEQIYDFLAKLPVDGQGHLAQLFDSDGVAYTDIFLKGHLFKTLYAIHAMREYLKGARPRTLVALQEGSEATSARTDNQPLGRCLRLIVDAISDRGFFDQASTRLQLRAAGSLVQTFVELFEGAVGSVSPLQLRNNMLPTAARLVDILSLADGDTSDQSFNLIDKTITAVLRVGSVDADFWNTTVRKTSFLRIVVKYLLHDPRQRIRQIIAKLIRETTMQRRQPSAPGDSAIAAADHGRHPGFIISTLYSAMADALPDCQDLSSQSEEYFGTLLHLIECSSAISASAVDAESLALVALELLLSHTSVEAIDRPEVIDAVAAGLISVLHLCLQIDANLTKSEKLDENHILKLFWRHLFPRKRRGEKISVPSVIVNTRTRTQLYEIIFCFVRSNFRSFRQILDTLNGLVPFYLDEPDEPYLYDLPFQFDRSRAVRATCGFVGLRNLSNTCYLNSLITQLFMNIPFRNFILAVPLQDPEGTQQLLFFTKQLFAYMQESYQRFIDPSAVVRSIKVYGDAQIDIHSQMDVDEFYNVLFDRWEAQLLDGSTKRQLRSFFGGQLVQQVKSMECEHISERLEPFSAIQCDIKGKSTLQESLQSYVDGEVLEGENKYKCSTCDRHVDAVKRACLKDVPDNLIFHLKRFDFNLKTLQRSKINDYFSFPLSLDIAPYTIESLNAEGASSQSDLFELVGILVHSGTAESGHYYSFVRDRRSFECPRWVEFNDESVAPWDPAFMESFTFGGPDGQSVLETNGIMYDKAYSAYMLFYQRASRVGATSASGPNAMPEGSTTNGEMPVPLKQHIWEENRMLVRRHCLYDPSHTIFVQRCFEHALILSESQPVRSQPPHGDSNGASWANAMRELKCLAMELAISHFDQVITRAKDTPFIGDFFSVLQTTIIKSPDCALEFFNYFHARPSSFRALLQRNPNSDVREFAGKAFLMALEKIRTNLPERYHRRSQTAISLIRESSESDDGWEEESESSVVQGTIDILNYLWNYFHVQIKSWDQHFAMMQAFARFGEVEVGYLLSENYLLKLLRIVNADPVLDLPPNYQRMLTNLGRRLSTNSKPASFAAVLALIDFFMSQLAPTLSTEVIVDDARERLRSQRPFQWSSDEVQAIHYCPDRQGISFFTKKLIDLEQAPELTDSIIGRMVESGEELDKKIFNTLRKSIQGDKLATQYMDAPIRAAGKYVDCSQSLERVQSLVRHICAQASCFQHNEGSVFLNNLVETIRQAGGPNETVARAKRVLAVQTVPTWAPPLLVYGDEQTRGQASRLVTEILFQPWSAVPLVEQGNGEADGQDIPVHVIRQLGIKCLVHLRDHHVNRKAQLESGAAGVISEIVRKCSPFYEPVDDLDECPDERGEFTALQVEITSPLGRLIVDEVDDDVSDWDGSCGSSDLLEASMGMATHDVNE